MTIQYSDTLRNSMLECLELVPNGQTLSAGTGSGGSVSGTAAAPILQLRSGAQPANCAAADSGTLIRTITLPANWMGDASSAVKQLAGSWTDNAAVAGTIGHYRIKNGAGSVCHEQGNVTMQYIISTNGTTAANGNVLNFASTTGVAVGMNVSGTGVPLGSEVVAFTGTTVTISRTSTAGVGSGVAITFGGDITLDNTTVTSGQVVTITSKNVTAPNP